MVRTSRPIQETSGEIVQQLDHVRYSTPVAENHVDYASNGLVPSGPLVNETRQTSASQETSVQQAEPSDPNPYPEINRLGDAAELWIR